MDGAPLSGHTHAGQGMTSRDDKQPSEASSETSEPRLGIVERGENYFLDLFHRVTTAVRRLFNTG